MGSERWVQDPDGGWHEARRRLGFDGRQLAVGLALMALGAALTLKVVWVDRVVLNFGDPWVMAGIIAGALGLVAALFSPRVR